MHGSAVPVLLSPWLQTAGRLDPEIDQAGNVEYKLKILPPSRERFDRLVTQLKWRLLEGGGVAVYEVGVLDDGTPLGLDTLSMIDSLRLLSAMAREVNAVTSISRVLLVTDDAVRPLNLHDAVDILRPAGVDVALHPPTSSGTLENPRRLKRALATAVGTAYENTMKELGIPSERAAARERGDPDPPKSQGSEAPERIVVEAVIRAGQVTPLVDYESVTV